MGNLRRPTHDEWREDLGCTVNEIYMGLAVCASSIGNMEVLDDLVPRMTRMLGGLDPTTLLQRTDLVWESGLPAARLARIRRAGHQVSFSNQPQSTDTEVMRGNMEVMAEVFLMSAELRRTSGLTAEEQLNMRHRLQEGQRSNQDRTILGSMLLETPTVELAVNIHREQLQQGPGANQQQTRLDEQRRLAARDGDFSRQGLDAQRRETLAFATAASRRAMQTGARALLGQAARSRIAQMGHTGLGLDGHWSSESEEEEEDQEQGLDAKDSGRPEPKSEEEMTVKLECRICYSQTADIACLPCGHLVMCKWCSEQHSPTMQHDRTRPRRAAACPVCRKGIRQKVRVFRGA